MGDHTEATRLQEAQQRTQLLQRVLVTLRPMRRMPIWVRYLGATLLVLAFYGVRTALGPSFQAYPYLLFFPAIITVSFVLDRGTGFYATLLAAALSLRLPAPGALADDGSSVANWVALAIFVAVGLFCAIVIEALRLTVDELGESEEALAADLERRERAEAALAESERRFRTTFELAAVGVAIVSTSGRWIQVNSRLCEMLGYTEGELISLSFQDITHPEDLDADLDQLGRLMAGELPSYTMEKRYRRSDSSYLWAELTVALVRNATGEPLHFISVVQDVGTRKAAQEVLERGRDELERLVEERTGALMEAGEERRRAEEALRQGEKLQAIGQLTGGIAHDFNNLLQIVSGSAQMLQNPRLTEARKNAVLEGLSNAAENAKQLTSRLLAFSRRQPLQPRTLDLNETLGAIAASLRQALGPKIVLTVSSDPDLWPVRLDASQLEIALLNLAVNAHDAMPEGGHVTIQARNTVLGSGADGAGECVDVKFRDDGPGMSARVLARVFEPFFTTKDPGRGTGLGLAQVHGFAKQSGGDVAIESAPGKGTTIILHLPRAPGETERRDEDDATALDPGRFNEIASLAEDRSILVVEDNEQVAAFTSSLLKDLGFATTLVTSATDALDALGTRAREFSAVLSDIVMPGMNGLELAVRIRELYPDLPVVLASGYSDALRNWEGERPAEVLSKPYTVDELTGALFRALAGVGEQRSGSER
jgi:PAS domain S-box-containing protein